MDIISENTADRITVDRLVESIALLRSAAAQIVIEAGGIAATTVDEYAVGQLRRIADGLIRLSDDVVDGSEGLTTLVGSDDTLGETQTNAGTDRRDTKADSPAQAESDVSLTHRVRARTRTNADLPEAATVNEPEKLEVSVAWAVTALQHEREFRLGRVIGQVYGPGTRSKKEMAALIEILNRDPRVRHCGQGTYKFVSASDQR